MGTRGGISRERFFLYAWLAGTLWYFVPGYLFQAHSYFSWVCWIAPDSIPVNQMFGYVHGMGVSLITFDWAQVGISPDLFSIRISDNCYRLPIFGSPLATPWRDEANVTVGFIFFFRKHTLHCNCS